MPEAAPVTIAPRFDMLRCRLESWKIGRLEDQQQAELSCKDDLNKDRQVQNLNPG